MSENGKKGPDPRQQSCPNYDGWRGVEVEEKEGFWFLWVLDAFKKWSLLRMATLVALYGLWDLASDALNKNQTWLAGLFGVLLAVAFGLAVVLLREKSCGVQGEEEGFEQSLEPEDDSQRSE